MANTEPSGPQAMTSERLAELREHRDEARYAAENDDDMEYDDPVILWQQFATDLTDSVAEVERLRAELATAGGTAERGAAGNLREDVIDC